MATQILTPNIPSCTYSLLYLKHEVHFANPGISYGCNKLKPCRAEEKSALKPEWLCVFSRRSIWLGDDLQKAHCSTHSAGVLWGGIATAVMGASGSVIYVFTVIVKGDLLQKRKRIIKQLKMQANLKAIKKKSFSKCLAAPNIILMKFTFNFIAK